jgi:hypothetical protein
MTSFLPHGAVSLYHRYLACISQSNEILCPKIESCVNNVVKNATNCEAHNFFQHWKHFFAFDRSVHYKEL